MKNPAGVGSHPDKDVQGCRERGHTRLGPPVSACDPILSWNYSGVNSGEKAAAREAGEKKTKPLSVGPPGCSGLASGGARDPKSLPVLKQHLEEKLLVTSPFPPPPKGSDGWGLRTVTPSKSPGPGEVSAARRRTRCGFCPPPPNPSAGACGRVPVPLGGKQRGESSGLREAPGVGHLPRPVEAALSCRPALRTARLSGPTISRRIDTGSEQAYRNAEALFV